jgi:hypothetical protein
VAFLVAGEWQVVLVHFTVAQLDFTSELIFANFSVNQRLA